jgi:hypothetical protein
MGKSPFSIAIKLPEGIWIANLPKLLKGDFEEIQRQIAADALNMGSTFVDL